jgi:uncharacterized cupredoxin-like copper-binding protein
MGGRWLAAIVLAALLGGCASGLGRRVVSVEALSDPQGVQHVDVDLHSFYFKPNRIVVHAGRPVDLTLHNRAVIVPHNFTIADPAIAVSENKWGLGAHHVRFIPVKPGEYTFFCHVDSHSKKGMTGTLVVVP